MDSNSVASALSRHLGGEFVVEGLQRLPGGASRETWAFDAVSTDGTRARLVLRRDPGEWSGAVARSTEYALLEAASRHDVLVPRVRFVLEESDELGAGFAMDYVAGETIARRILRDDVYREARTDLARQCGEQAARIHALPIDDLPELEVAGPPELLAQYRKVLDDIGEPHPAFELGLRWLHEHMPEPVPGRVVHGDFRNGNLVVGSDGLHAVLDWELAHLGDPVEDLGWFCVRSWRFGADDKRAGGFGPVDDLLRGYREAGGGEVDPERLHYWEVFGNLKWGAICAIQASLHLTGVVRSVELAVLGRRIAEMEWDLLELLS